MIRAVKDEQRSAELGLLRAHATRLRVAADRRLLTDGALWLALPSSPAARRRRGFCLSSTVFPPAPTRVHDEVIWAVRSVRDQRQLGVGERRRNLRGALHADRAAVRGRAIVLVDDVITTGATMQAAIEAVDDAGGTVVGAVALARTPRALASASLCIE